VKKSATERYLDCSPNGLRRDCEESLKNLQVDSIALYHMHWVDPDVALADSVSSLAQLKQEGKIQRIGLSNITLEQLKEAEAITSIDAVQNRYSITERDSEALVDYCTENGTAFLPYGPLNADPMKAGAPLAGAGGAIAEVARELRVSNSCVALAWLLQRSPNVIPIPGTTSISHLEENWSATKINFAADQLAFLSQSYHRTSPDPVQ
jgi:pyridoxine 4-dehydrogenase